MSRITDGWLTQQATQRLFQLFAAEGYALYAVGGCVRNALLHRPVADIDMSTDARPQQMLDLARAHQLKAVPTGIDHGTVTLMSGGVPFEVTTFRHDTQTDGRHARVTFSDRLEEDAQRRDFTMNALYCDAEGRVTDTVAGLRDLNDRRVRFIGEASARITEDYLRILRFFRFTAWYGDPEGGIDADGLAACAEHADGLERLSRERVGAEMIKLLTAPDPAPAVAAMQHAGILARVMPGAEATGLAVLIHLEDGATPDWTRRALLLGGEEVSDRWRLSKAQARRLSQARHDLEAGTPPAEMAYRHGADHARNVGVVAAAASGQPAPADLEQQIAKGAKASFPVNAADLQPRYQGKALGEHLRACETRWIASGFTLTKRQLLAE